MYLYFHTNITWKTSRVLDEVAAVAVVWREKGPHTSAFLQLTHWISSTGLDISTQNVPAMNASVPDVKGTFNFL